MKTTHPHASSEETPISCLREVASQADLVALHDPSVQMVTWKRQFDPIVVNFGREVLTEQPFELREPIKIEALGSFDPLPEFARANAPEAAELFAQDARSLIELFSELTGCGTVGYRLVHLTETMCPRFHADYIPMRLLITYCGKGTEWLADQDVDRSHLGVLSEDVPDEESGLMLPNAAVRYVPELTVALLKGREWPGNVSKGAVHRSPSLGAHEGRILMSLDMLD